MIHQGHLRKKIQDINKYIQKSEGADKFTYTVCVFIGGQTHKNV